MASDGAMLFEGRVCVPNDPEHLEIDFRRST